MIQEAVPVNAIVISQSDENCFRRWKVRKKAVNTSTMPLTMSFIFFTRREKAILQKSVANVDDLRREVYHLQRELLRERTRCKALEEELENPMNIHRWRKLEGSDPSTYEMIQKIQTLQKRLIAKTEEVTVVIAVLFWFILKCPNM